MSLKEKISKDYMTAFKERNAVAKNLLSVVKGEIQTIEKNTSIENMSDEDVTKILNKTVKSLKETLSNSYLKFTHTLEFSSVTIGSNPGTLMASTPASLTLA